MSDNEQATWPPSQRDLEPGSTISDETLYTMQLKQEDGRWRVFEAARDRVDRAEMTRIQAFRAREKGLAGEKRRILRKRTVWEVDEIEGDGDGETSVEELLARNEENTKRLLEQDTTEKDGS